LGEKIKSWLNAPQEYGNHLSLQNKISEILPSDLNFVRENYSNPDWHVRRIAVWNISLLDLADNSMQEIVWRSKKIIFPSLCII
jgi:hypothetical protein